MEETLKNYMWAVYLVVIAICAWLLAGLVATFFAFELTTTSVPPAAPSAQIAPDPTTLAEVPQGKDAILKRNLLNRNLNENPEGDLPGGDMIPGQTAVKSDLKHALLGTVVTPDPQKCLATVQIDKDIKHYKVGDQLEKKHPIQKIERGRIEFFNRTSGRLEFLAFAERKIGAPPPRGPKGINATGESELVTKTGDSDFVIDQKEWDKSLANLNQIMTQARAVPNIVGNGKVEGFRVFAIRPDSVYQKLGLVNGDILLNVNGLDIDSINKALTVFESLKSEHNFEIKLNRGGQPRNFKYEVR